MTSMQSVRAARALSDARVFSTTGDDVIVVREERAGDLEARERLLDAALGPDRRAKTSEALRAGRLPARGLALVATDGRDVVGTVRLWHVRTGDGRPALLLGPLAVAASHRSLGVGSLLMREAIARARSRGHGAILLVGDEPYYRRFGFDAGLTRALDLPGPIDRDRFLGLELAAGALVGASGVVVGSGARAAPVWRASGKEAARGRSTPAPARAA